VLPADPAAATTEVVEDIDDGPLGGVADGSDSGHHFSLKALMAGPLGDAVGRTDNSHHCLATIAGVDVVDGRPPGRQYRSQERPPPSAIGRRWRNQAPS
jgi:hypothetical protein